MVLDRRAAHVIPQETVEPLRIPDAKIGLRIADGRFDLAPVADDARILQQSRDLGLAPVCHDLRVEPGEGRPEIVALPQDGDP